MTPFEEFSSYIGEINDIFCAISLLNWDANTNMPSGGAKVRGQQMATLVKLAQERFTSNKMGTLLARAETAVSHESPRSYNARAVTSTRHAYDVARRIPATLLGEHVANRSLAEQAWQEAKANDDFGRFAPYLERYVALNREITAVIGYDDHPYDAMLLRYEPGMTVARLQPLFAELKAGLLPLLDQVVNSGVKMPVEILHGDFPVGQQKAFCYQIAQAFGYDMTRGHFGEAPHPFEISFTRQDVRITNRYQPSFLAGGLFGMLHEAGHALYEQGVDPQLTRTALATDFLSQYAVGGVTFGAHESQSRLWENQIGRSEPFWQRHFSELQTYFPQQLANVDAHTFYRAVNHVEPSYIRVEADELTYNLHIMLRLELEMGLLDGSITVNELPQIWREKMESYLGVVPPTDTLGVLQDIHWAFGQMGTFPAYTIGNVMSAQFFQAAHAAMPDLADQLADGNYRPLRLWLTENIYRHGRAYSPDELLEAATATTLQTKPYLDYLQAKFSDLYL
ncbi:MAG: carboxypeptidase M32 [Chloroflexota bacterium]